MDKKTNDPEAPAQTSHHLESSISVEKYDAAEIARTWSRDVVKDTNTKLKNPLAGLSREELYLDIEEFTQEKNLGDIVELLKRGALVAQDPRSFELLNELSEDEKELLRREKTHRWNQPFMMYFMTSTSPSPFPDR
jgi:hypothetical protein